MDIHPSKFLTYQFIELLLGDLCICLLAQASENFLNRLGIKLYPVSLQGDAYRFLSDKALLDRIKLVKHKL